MSAILASQRSVQGFITLLASALLLLISSYGGYFDSKNALPKNPLVGHQVSVETAPTFNPNLPISHAKHKVNISSSLVGRASDADFQRYKIHGDVAYNSIQGAFAGCGPVVQVFDSRAFENGWTRSRDANDLLDPNWEAAFMHLLELDEDELPTEEQTFYVEVILNKPFTNSQGQIRQVCPSSIPTHPLKLPQP
ncbi:MAG: hypothetical protein L6R39_005574 [Caloplaca ligustica]|nr:MAG: hypothetical protein L6R39_005574 [Caloplaca ligustica]